MHDKTGLQAIGFMYSPVALAALGPDGTVLAHNEAFLVLSGHDHPEGRNLTELIECAEADFPTGDGETGSSEAPLQNIQFGIVRKTDEKVLISKKNSPQSDGAESDGPQSDCAGSGGSIYSFIDLAVLDPWLEHRMLDLENRVRERTAELQKANKELETFSYSVSHDLRAPLRSVLGFGAALEEDYGEKLGLEGKDYISRMTAAARRMEQLINAILSVSRISRAAINRESVDLTALAWSIVNDSKRSYPSIKVSVAEGMKTAADPDLARVVLTNLIDNSCKFLRDAQEPKIEVGMAFDGDEPTFYVRDNGIGFDMQYAERIFRPFERPHTDAEFPGTGIGLANVARVIDRHQGKIWVESEKGSGTTFYFTLEPQLKSA